MDWLVEIIANLWEGVAHLRVLRWCTIQNWMAAYLGYTLRMRTLFRGWPIMVNDTHTRRRRLYKHTITLVLLLWIHHWTTELSCVQLRQLSGTSAADSASSSSASTSQDGDSKEPTEESSTAALRDNEERDIEREREKGKSDGDYIEPFMKTELKWVKSLYYSL